MSEFPLPRSKHFYKRWWFWLIIVLVVFIGGGILVAMVGRTANSIAAYDYLKESIKVTRRSLKKTIATSGVIVTDGTTQLVPSAPGKVKKININVGDNVEEGDILLETDAVIGKELKAPFDGRVLALDTMVGDMVMPTRSVVTIGYRTSHIELFASDSDVIDLRINQPAIITVPVYNDGQDEFIGKVTFVDVKKEANTFAAGTQSGTQAGYRVRVQSDTMPKELSNILGLNVDVTITVADRSNVLSLERGAVQYDDDHRAFVYMVPTVDEEFAKEAHNALDVAELLAKKNVTVGFEGDNYIEIVDGLAENDVVLLYIPARTPSLF